MQSHIEGGRDCREFLDRYSDFRDGCLSPAARVAHMSHLASCPSCQRYDRVIRTGVSLLNDSPVAPPGRGLEIVSVERRARSDRGPRSPYGTGSGMTAAAAALVAAVLGAVAWAPVLFGGDTPEVELAPVVASAPSAPRGPAYFPLPAAFPFEATSQHLESLARSMLFQYGRARPVVRNAVTAQQPE